MSLTPRLIAIQGIGMSAITMAIQGLLAVQDAPAGASPVRWFPFHAIPRRRPRKKRQDDLLFLRP